MKVVYLSRALHDLAWFRFYYQTVFPEGAIRGNRQFLKSLDLLTLHPHMGHPIGKRGRRQYSIPGIPFTIIYRASPNVLEIVRVLDERGDRTLPARNS
jgi:plasmid stabilization system protein ParE